MTALAPAALLWGGEAGPGCPTRLSLRWGDSILTARALSSCAGVGTPASAAAGCENVPDFTTLDEVREFSDGYSRVSAQEAAQGHHRQVVVCDERRGVLGAASDQVPAGTSI